MMVVRANFIGKLQVIYTSNLPINSVKIILSTSCSTFPSFCLYGSSIARFNKNFVA